MSKAPFEKFILAFLIAGKDIPTIISKLKEFSYYIEEKEVVEIFEQLKMTVSENLRFKLDSKTPWSIHDKQDIQWLKQLGLMEFYDYLVRRNDKDIVEVPEYFKWFKDCLFIHAHIDIMSLVNIFLFNQEGLDSISDIISFRYHKKIGVEALTLYNKIYWDCSSIDSHAALYYCMPFRKNALIIKNIKYANISTIERLEDDESDGSDSSFIFHDSSYLKWKIGYKKVEVPGTKDFLEQVKKDSYFKYYEAMNMAQSVEVESEEGTNSFGPFDRKLTKRRNVEEQRARAAKHWFELFVKADEAAPEGKKEKEEDFLSKMNALELDYKEEKIVSIEDNPSILEDLKGGDGVLSKL